MLGPAGLLKTLRLMEVGLASHLLQRPCWNGRKHLLVGQQQRLFFCVCVCVCVCMCMCMCSSTVFVLKNLVMVSCYSGISSCCKLQNFPRYKKHRILVRFWSQWEICDSLRNFCDVFLVLFVKHTAYNGCAAYAFWAGRWSWGSGSRFACM